MDVGPGEPFVVLTVGPDRDALERVATGLERERPAFTVETVTSLDAAVTRLDASPPVDCVVGTAQFSNTRGPALLERVRADYPDLPFVICLPEDATGAVSDAISAGATEFLLASSGEDYDIELAHRVEHAVVHQRGEASGGNGSDRQRELERYETLVQIAGDGVYMVDAEGRFVMVNDRLVDRTGYDRDELVGQPASCLIRDEDVDRVERLIGELLRENSGDYAEYEVMVETADGNTYPAEVRMAPIVDDGEFRGTIGISRDIADRKERERRLRRQNERLEGFVKVVSHDLRNPLTVATGRLEAAMAECDSEHLDHVERSLERMEELIDDLLVLAREGRRVEDPEPVDLATVARNAWATVETEHADLRVRTDRTIDGDGQRVRQALENLFGNAVQHGGSDVTVTVGDLPDGFYVADDGPGVPPTARETVFEAGYSGDGGTGLGLLIVSEIAEAHGWEVELTESDPDGARFEITGVGPDSANSAG